MSKLKNKTDFRMRLLLLGMALFCMSFETFGQKVLRAEYFFDTDPGAGNAIPLSLTPADSIHIQTGISVATLSVGIHRIGIRFMDSAGVWSMYDIQSFYIYPEETFASPIVSGETFAGAEPIQGNGQSFSFPRADSVNQTLALSTVSWNTGMNQISVRFRDSLQRWGLYESARVYLYDSISINTSLTRAEYFFNTDPGIGWGIPISFSTTDSVNWTALNIPVSSLPQGRHSIHLRFLNNYQQWSHYESASFFVTELEPAAPILTQAEYFFDTFDPGFGRGVPLLVSASDSLDFARSLPVGTLDTGWHQLHVRVKDAAGQWSHYETFAFYICSDFPRAAFGFSQFGLTVNFNNTSAGATRFLWNYGNGTQSSQVSPTYSYAAAGSYLVTLFAFNGNCPLKDSSSAFVGISPAFTVSVQNSQVCTHDSLRLSIATTESFASNNQFYIYLSDSTGLFTNATLLDVLTAKASTLHAVYVPVFIPKGNKYRIRIEATSPNSISADNGTDISVLPVTFSSFTYTGDTLFCKGNHLLLQGVSGNSLAYQWFRNNELLQGATIRDFPAFLEGAYRLRVTNVWGCINLSVQQVNLGVKPAPTTPDITGNTLVGRNALATYAVNPFHTGSTYQWTVTGGTQIAGGNGNIISVQWGNNPVLGKVEVTEKGQNGCIGEVKSIQVSVALSSMPISEGKFQVYPNPFDRDIYISNEELSSLHVVMELTDAQGRIVYVNQWGEAGSNLHAQLPQLPAGIYHLLLRSPKGIHTIRLIRY